MTASTVIGVLENLRFVDGRAVLQIDREVRDYLVNAVRCR